jgi:trehalose 6-phosphate phosphatase
MDPRDDAVRGDGCNDGTRRAPPPATPGHWALFLDVDGCLLDFADAPDAVQVPGGLEDAITACARRLDGAVALVSGRSLDTLDALFPALRALPAAGLHGLERRGADGERHAPPAPPAALADVAAEARRVAEAYPGAIIETKGPNLALHWRRAPQAATALRALAAAELPRLPGYRLQAGDHVVELRPGGDADKGSAILAFLGAAPFRGRVPVFLGDDLTDERGFAAVNARGGISVLVGTRADSAARHALRDPPAVRAWLAAACAEALQA